MTIQPYEPTQSTDSWVPVLQAVGDLATKLAGTPFVPKAMQRQPAAVAAAILTGREMHLGPMASLRGIDVIEGRPRFDHRQRHAPLHPLLPRLRRHMGTRQRPRQSDPNRLIHQT